MSEVKNILLIEDDRHIALALQIRLGAVGFSVRVAASVAQATALLQERVPDVAVIDVNLPDGDGISLMRSFASLDLEAPIQSIVMSASRRPGLIEEALAAGAVTFLEKPFPSSALIDALASTGPRTLAS